MKQVDLPPLVLSGKLDRILESLLDACIARQRVLREQRNAHNVAAFTPGTRVRVSRSIRPKYLGGLTGEVITRIPSADFSPRFRNQLPVKLDAGRVGKYGPVVHFPASALERE